MLRCETPDDGPASTVFLTRGQLLALADTALRIAKTLDVKEA